MYLVPVCFSGQARGSGACIDEAWWLSWLERRPVTAEVEGSNPSQVVLPELCS